MEHKHRMEESIAKAESLKAAIRHIQQAIVNLSDAAVALHFAGRRNAGDECQKLGNAVRELLNREGAHG